MKENIRKIQNIYELVGTYFYLGEESFAIGDRRYDPVALFGILNLILDGKELIFGEYFPQPGEQPLQITAHQYGKNS